MVLLLGICLVVAGDFGTRLVFRYPQPKPNVEIKENNSNINKNNYPSSFATASNAINRINQPRTPPRSNRSLDLSVPAPVITTATAISEPVTSTSTVGSLTSSTALPSPPSNRPPLHHSTSVTFERYEPQVEVRSSSPIELPPSHSSTSILRRRSTGRSLLSKKNLSAAPSSAAAVAAAIATPSSSTSSLGAGLPLSTSNTAFSHEERVWGLPVFEFQRFFSPLSTSSPASSPHLIDVTVNTVRFLSYPIHLSADCRHEHTSFAIVLALREDAYLYRRHTHEANLNHPEERINWTNHVTSLYVSILVSLSNALVAEQSRVAFLSQQANLLHTITEQYWAEKQLITQKAAPHPIQQIPPPSIQSQSRRRKKDEEKIDSIRPPSVSPPPSPTHTSVNQPSLLSLHLQKSILAMHFTSVYKICRSLERRSYRCISMQSAYEMTPEEEEEEEEEKDDNPFSIGVKGEETVERSPTPEIRPDDVCGHILLNDWLHLYISLAPQTIVPQHIKELLNEEDSNSEEGDKVSPSLSDPSLELPFPIKPFQTLLLRTSATRLISSLSADASPLLTQLILLTHPTLSLFTLSERLSLPLLTILLLASHLLNWNAATLIDTIALPQKYVVASTFESEGRQAAANSSYPSNSLQSSFQKLFPNSSLVELLAEFSTPRVLSDHLQQEADRLATIESHSPNGKKQKNSTRGILSPFLWILQRGLLMQCKTYIVDIESNNFPFSTGVPPSGRTCCSCCPCNRLPLSICVNTGKCVCPACRNLAVILPYCNGKYDLSYIVWAEREKNLTLEKLEQLIETHAHRLVSVLHT